MRIAIVGFGRMGRMVYGKIVESGVHAISAVIDPYAAGPGITSRELTAAALASSDAAIDFTAPEKALENIGIYAEASIPAAIGTTGWYERMDEAKAIVERTGARIICSANFSIGVSIFLQLVSEAGRLIDKAGGYDAAIEEIHHRGKADAPSGTALMAAERLISAMHAKTGIIRGNPEGRIPDDRIGMILFVPSGRTRQGRAVIRRQSLPDGINRQNVRKRTIRIQTLFETVHISRQQCLAHPAEPERMLLILAQRLRQSFGIESRQRVDQFIGRRTGRVAPSHHRIENIIRPRSIPAFAPWALEPVAASREKMPAPVQSRFTWP